jgi:hypothetical protein
VSFSQWLLQTPGGDTHSPPTIAIQFAAIAPAKAWTRQAMKITMSRAIAAGTKWSVAARCGIFATLAQYFHSATVMGGFSGPMSQAYNKVGGVLDEHLNIVVDSGADLRARGGS